MNTLYTLSLRVGLAATLGLATLTARAQAPAWNLATRLDPTNNVAAAHTVNRVVADGAGNLIVAGFFQGQFTLGTTTLTSAGGIDLYVAKYLPATGTWAWAYRGGGTDFDWLTDVVVSGNSVYVVGFINNSTTNTNRVLLGSAGSTGVRVMGATSTASQDMLLAKYTDNGNSATLNWTQVGGGTGVDYATRVAVSGSNVYVVGNYTNTRANARQVVLGGDGTTAGTVPVRGAAPGTTSSSDVLLAKYTDQGSSAVLRWVQVAGGPQDDTGFGVAVQGSAVYLTGSVAGNNTSAGAVTLGGDGTTPGTALQYGASPTTSNDILLARYTDNGTTATFNWSQVAGGTGYDTSQDLVVNGTSVYVLGTAFNNLADANAVVLGGSGATPGTRVQLGASSTVNRDILVAKYTDNGTSAAMGWSQVGGGTGNEDALDLAVNGQGVYLIGTFRNDVTNTSSVRFGGSGAVAGTVPVGGATSVVSDDVLVARYQDNGNAATVSWVQVGGSPGSDTGNTLVLTGQSLYTISYSTLPATYGSLTVAGASGESSLVIARLTDTALPTRTTRTSSALVLYPNPAASYTTLRGAVPGAPIQLFDVLSRQVATVTADKAGTAVFGGLAPGFYVVRVGSSSMRLVVK